MKIRVTIQKDLEDWWFSDENLTGLSQDEITTKVIDTVMEDYCALLDGASWKVEVLE